MCNILIKHNDVDYLNTDVFVNFQLESIKSNE